MKSQYLVILLGALITAVLGYLIQDAQSEAKRANDNFQQLTLQTVKQSQNISANGKLIKQLLEKLSEQEQKNNLSFPSNKIKFDTSKLDSNMAGVKAGLATLQQQVNELKKVNKEAREVNTNLPTDTKIEDVVASPQIQRQIREEQMKKDIQQMESTYEATLTAGEKDINWTSNIESKLQGLISKDKIGKDVQLLNVECATNLCKIALTQSDQSSLDDFALTPVFGNATVYINKVENSPEGQQEYIMYVSKEGEDLPPIERN